MKRLYLLAALAIASPAAADYLPHETLVFRSGSDQKTGEFGVRQYRIPHLATGPNGELIASVAGRTNKAGDNGRTTSVFAVSKDAGVTWEAIHFESDYTKPTAKGAFPMSSRTNEVQLEWLPAAKEYIAIFADKNKCHQIRSKDLKTWSEPRLLPHQENLSHSWPSPTSIHIVKDGTLCFNLIAVQEGKPFANRSVQMFWTKDGETYETSPPAPFSTGESNAMAVGDGCYLHIARTHQVKLNRLRFDYDRSTKKWSPHDSLKVPTHYSCEQDLLAHGDSLYLSVPRGKGRSHGVIYRSTDQGKSWTRRLRTPD